MKLFNRKKLQCKLCEAEVAETKSWTLQLNTSEGEHSIQVCSTCADAMNEIKGNIGNWIED